MLLLFSISLSNVYSQDLLDNALMFCQSNGHKFLTFTVQPEKFSSESKTLNRFMKSASNLNLRAQYVKMEFINIKLQFTLDTLIIMSNSFVAFNDLEVQSMFNTIGFHKVKKSIIVITQQMSKFEEKKEI